MIEGSRLLEIEHGGHISNIEKPTILNTAVAKVFDESSRAAHRPS
jgi:pimeloyl-ACP methyl ester carboxylesterase